MMLLRRGNKIAQPELVAMIREVAGAHGSDELRACIAAGSVPDWFVATALDYLEGHPGLAGISDVEFLAAMRTARPELGAVLETPAGRKWAEHVAWRVVGALPGRWLGDLFRSRQ